MGLGCYFHKFYNFIINFGESFLYIFEDNMPTSYKNLGLSI
jgi:hypothetical protein